VRTVADRARALEPLGLSPRQARFLATVALHSGYCLRRQYAAFAGVANAKNVSAFLDGLVARRWADRFTRRADRGHVYHLHTRGIYRLLGQDESRNRRSGSAAFIGRRLMLLDYVLAHPETEWLATDTDKVAWCVEQGAVPRQDLPQQVSAPARPGAPSLIRYFPHNLPIGTVGTPPETYFVALVTAVDGRAFAHFLTAHAAVLRRVRRATVVAVAPRSCPGLATCPDVFARVFQRGGPIVGARADELRWFLQTRHAVDRGHWAGLSVADLDRFRTLRDRLASPDVEALYQDWLTRGDIALEIPAAAVAPGEACRLVTETLPFDYSQFGSLPGVA
jgi:hypothetical protein